MAINKAAQELAQKLRRQAQLLAEASKDVAELAERAASGDEDNGDEGRGYHYLASRALRKVHDVLNNGGYDHAFEAAARADRPAP